MENTLGKRISELRKRKGITQEELAEALGVSAQAVSKWENEISCPDISLLPRLGELLGVTVDELLSGKTENRAHIVPTENRKRFEDLLLRVAVSTVGTPGVNVKVNLPMPLVQLALKTGVPVAIAKSQSAESLLNSIDLNSILAQVIEMAESGMMGELVNVVVKQESCDVNVSVTVE